MATSSHVLSGADLSRAQIEVRRIGFEAIRRSLRRGLDDFMAMPTHLAFLGVIYPLFGVGLGAATFTSNALPLLFPLVSGFALVGPVAAIGIYEISRRRERGWAVSWLDAFSVLRSPAILSIVALGLMLLVIFGLWVLTAQWIYESTVGALARPSSVGEFVHLIRDTPEGWRLVLFGNAAGFLFAVAVLALTVVSFPMLLDRDVGPGVAVRTSLRAVAANPGPMAAWGLVVAALLLLGSLPLFVGLAVAMPVLGHGTWHLYRKVVE